MIPPHINKYIQFFDRSNPLMNDSNVGGLSIADAQVPHGTNDRATFQNNFHSQISAAISTAYSQKLHYLNLKSKRHFKLFECRRGNPCMTVNRNFVRYADS